MNSPSIRPASDRPGGGRTVGGRPIPLALHHQDALRHAHGGISGLVGISRDITERKSAEEKLKLYAAELEAARDVQEKNTRKLTKAFEELELPRHERRPPAKRRASSWPI